MVKRVSQPEIPSDEPTVDNQTPATTAEIDAAKAQPEKPDENAAIKEAFTNTISKCTPGNIAEDEVKLAMIRAGATFKNVTRLYNEYLVDSGLAMSKEEREGLVEKVITESDNVSEEAGFDAVVARLVENGNNLDAKQASVILRAYCKKKEVECFKKPKGVGGAKSGFREDFFSALEKNPAMTKDEASALINDVKNSKSVKARENMFQRIRLMANRISGTEVASGSEQPA